jgi:predicted O-methyltransferase YrrM
MELLPPAIARYLDAQVPPREPELQAMEADAAKTSFPIIGPAAGYFCYLVTRLSGAHSVFELGSGFGYSTAWFARGVKENGGGVVHHTVWDADLSARARRHLTALGLDHLIRYHAAEAVATLQDTPGRFDLIFNDIDKAGYPASLPVIYSKLRSGGVLIVDNLLWSGKVLDQEDRSSDTEGVREFTRLVMNDPRWTASIVPIRDGLLFATKR